MEACANALSPASKPVVVCRSAKALMICPPSGITKKSAFFATIGHGAFTVEADKKLLGPVVESLVEVRKKYALEMGDLFMYRVCHCAKAKLLQGGMELAEPLVEEPYEQWMVTMRFEESELGTEGSQTGLTPLRYAIYAGRIDIAQQMLKVCPSIDVEAPLKFSIPLVEGPKAQTILMAACAWHDNGQLIQWLHNSGADMCRLDKGMGHFSTVYAAGNENLQSLHALLKIGSNHQGQDVSAYHGGPLAGPDPECKIYARNWGIFVMFAEYGCLDGLKGFASKHPEEWARIFAQPLAGAPHMGLNIISHSINVYGDVDMLIFLCDEAKANGCDGANFSIRCTDPRALKVIGMMKTVLRLTKRPPQVVNQFINTLFSTTPLHSACFAGNLGAVEYLLSIGARVDSQEHLIGRTPLMLAAIMGHDVICMRLVQAGASLEIKDTRKGKTAAQWAAYKGRRDLAKSLKPGAATAAARAGGGQARERSATAAAKPAVFSMNSYARIAPNQAAEADPVSGRCMSAVGMSEQ